MNLEEMCNIIINDFTLFYNIKSNIVLHLVNKKYFKMRSDSDCDLKGLTENYSIISRDGVESMTHNIFLATKWHREKTILHTLGHELMHILIKEKEEEICDNLGIMIVENRRIQWL